MTAKTERKREYNHAKLLAEKLSVIINVPVANVIVKLKETERQARLGKKDRLKNLIGVFKITNKKLIKDKTILIVDDVTTTGATAEVISAKLKKAGAKRVMLLTVASVPSIQ
jgi:competence protein ComFC